ncbi:NERD domain-containing protein [Vibrio splendidus]|uniref:NERD domain-containing protein n=1 Tax=Vibrio splendidus TaxID=29497 RepID=UPI001FB2C296|nr:NERD domain-containing protein [Vibrio splendidus]UOE87334.1 NERD domain-containing protein [Vibrio splendidus]UOE90770.1 NERD domain-containing protein [Vibrio splendidus]
MFNFIRGWFGEKKTTLNLWATLSDSKYHRYHDLYIPTYNGTAQIDHLVISQYGIFVVETKNYKGWVFGDEYSAQWTQSLYGKKYRFQNPLRQTYRQKKALAAYFDIDEDFVETVVYFTGGCKLKTKLPSNVRFSGLGRYLKSFKSVVFSQDEVNELLNNIDNHKKNCTTTNRQHVKALRQRHGSKTHCPKCGSLLVQRTARKGLNAGNTFYGCQGFPKCRFIKN